MADAPNNTTPPSQTSPSNSAAHAADGKEPLHPGVPELMRKLLSSVDDEPEKKPETPAAPATPADAPAAPTTPEKPIVARKPKPPERPELPKKESVVALAPAAAAPKPEPAAELNDADLEENEREMLKEAAEAEKIFGDKRKGLTGQVKKFIKDHMDYVAQPDFDAESDEYRQWLLQNQPRLTPTEQRAMQESRLSERVQKETDTRFGAIKHELFVKEREPQIASEGQAFYNQLANEALPQEVKDMMIADQKLPADQRQAMKVYGVEMGIAHSILTAARGDVQEFMRITTKDPGTGKPVVEICNDPRDPKFQQHNRLADMVRDICQSFARGGGTNRVKNGRWFVTRDEFADLPNSEKPKFWTFSNKEIIDRARAGIPGVVKTAIDREIKSREAQGFRRVLPAPAAAAVPERRDGAPPSRHPSASPAGSPDGGISDGAKLARALNVS